MNDQKIFECIAINGTSTDIELAIWLDTTSDDVRGQCAALVSVGDILATDDGPTQAYVFSGKFQRSPDYAKLMRRADIAKFQRQDEPPETVAVRFLEANDRECTGAELALALGLTGDQMPSQVLADALAAGRIFKDGKHWFLDRRDEPRALPAVPTPALALPDGMVLPRLLAPAAEAVRIWPKPEVSITGAKVSVPQDQSFGFLRPAETPPVLRMQKRHDKSVSLKRGADRISLTRSEIEALALFAQENDAS